MKDITIIDESLQLLCIMDILKIMIYFYKKIKIMILFKKIFYLLILVIQIYHFFFCQNLNMMISVLYIESEPNLRGRNFNYALY